MEQLSWLTSSRSSRSCRVDSWRTLRVESSLLVEQGSSALSDKDEKQLLEFAKGFYSVHVAGVVRRGLLEYLHISKSGGTSFSHAAKANGCDMEGSMGQLEELGDLPRWVNGSAFKQVTGAPRVMWDAYGEVERRTTARSCEARKAHVQALGHNYVSNEYTLHGGLQDMAATHVCPQMVNVVTLRNPLNRLESHLHYMLPFMSRAVRRQAKDAAAFARAFCSGRPGVWEAVTPAVADNYNVRSFVGESAFHSPVGGIGQAHVALAKSLLVQFDLVLDLDAGEAAASLIMGQGLGWGKTLSEVRARTSQRVSSKLGFSEADCPREGLADLLPRQQPDVQLYRLGRVLSFLDGMFLDLAREAGQTPEGAAAAAAADGDGDSDGGDGQRTAEGQGDASAGCGILGSSRQRGGGAKELHLELRSTSKPDHRMHDNEEESDEETDPELMSWPPLLATICLSGVGRDVSAGIHTLVVDADAWGLPSLVNTAALLSGGLTNVRELQIDCWRRAEDDVGNPRAAYAALVAAMPRLEKLALPFNSWLPGCEALDGSSVTSIKLGFNCGALHVEDARALTQIRQLTHLELNMDQWLLQQVPEPVRPLSFWADEGEEETFPSDESDAQVVASLHPEHAEQLGALRWLLVHAPPALRSLRFKCLHGQLLPPPTNSDNADKEGSDGFENEGEGGRKRSPPEMYLDDVAISFEGGAVAFVEVGKAVGDRGTPREVAAGLNFLAAALLPRLAATGQRQLPLLKLGCLEESSSNLLQYLVQQPRSPLVRLLELCERKELGTLRLLELSAIAAGPSAADNDVSRALQAVVSLIGLPGYLQSDLGDRWGFRVRMGPCSDDPVSSAAATPAVGAGRGRGIVHIAAASGSSSAGGGDAAVGGAAGAALPVATAEWVLTRAAQLLWGVATGESGPDASAAAYELARRPTAGEDDMLHRSGLQDHFVVLRGQLIRQLLLSSDGPKLLHAWLTGVLNNSKSLGVQQAGTAAVSGGVASALASDRDPAGAKPAGPAGAAPAHEEMCCGAMSIWPPAATAVVGCWTPKEAERLARAAAEAGAVAVGSLEVCAMSTTKKTLHMMPEKAAWNCLINMALQQVWDARSRSGLLAGSGTAAAPAGTGGGGGSGSAAAPAGTGGGGGSGSAAAAAGTGGGGGSGSAAAAAGTGGGVGSGVAAAAGAGGGEGAADGSGASNSVAAGPSTTPGASAAAAGASAAAGLDTVGQHIHWHATDALLLPGGCSATAAGQEGGGRGGGSGRGGGAPPEAAADSSSGAGSGAAAAGASAAAGLDMEALRRLVALADGARVELEEQGC
ncbi:hypothetical protein HYH02_001100 [Chlamydomonas schloesseri]|uniref:Sulfotransferase n=1 Tax=Chlamydomonas schloesseri TaxID=2026947 RepID=A0A836BCS8_9CHLO|nr:hypothetical protein HYH02_001100 [Chlamydomonas schloesseri]|eukprot:KAG2454059.1 hypothetical protein HYH02_001100 [Chlamydomonas schloesseri]